MKRERERDEERVAGMCNNIVRVVGKNDDKDITV